MHIMRHGKTKWNAEGRLQGRKNSPLLEESLSQIAEQCRFLPQSKIKRVFTSPLERCVITADIVCKALGLPYTKDSLLSECSLGDFEGMTLVSAQEQYRSFFQQRKEDTWNTPWPNGESYADVYHRAVLFFKNISSPYDDILIITHEMCGKCIAGLQLRWAQSQIMERKISPASILYIEEGLLTVIE